MTASAQWLERTLDDSANRRIVVPEAFMCADAVLRLACNVISGLKINEKMTDKALREYLPFISTENILMEAVKRGGDRQELHEHIRKITVRASEALKQAEDFDILGELAADSSLGLTREELDGLMDPSLYTGRCAEQVTAFLEKIRPLISSTDKEEVTIEV
jgi:adenylosuccinate lyase